MEELPPLVPDLTAWFEALLARVAALEARSEQGGAAATAKAEAQDRALQELETQRAAAAVARKLRLCDEQVEVQMPGGSLMIQIDDDGSVLMRGPVTAVGSMKADPGIIE